MTAQTAVTVQHLTDDPAQLLTIYPGQTTPQPCYIALDLRDGRVSAGTSHEFGNAVPADVWHGIVRRFPLPLVTAATANQILDVIAPRLQIILEHSRVEWDGSNHVGRLDETGQAEAEALHETLSEIDGELHWWDAEDWFAPERNTIIEELRSGVTVDALAEMYDGDGTSEDAPVVIGIREYLERLQVEAE